MVYENTQHLGGGKDGVMDGDGKCPILSEYEPGNMLFGFYYGLCSNRDRKKKHQSHLLVNK